MTTIVNPNKQPVLACNGLCKTYSEGSQTVEVLRDIAFEVQAGERVAIMGSSGAGKSTLLNLLGGLDTPGSGEVTVAGKNLFDLDQNGRGKLRNRHMGFVYQFHHLLGEFSALENVLMPLMIAKTPLRQAREQARELLARVGLEQRFDHKPAQLSGGERQRVAIARAMVTKPDCVLMDEPTGNLDQATAGAIQRLMEELNREFKLAFVIVTHDQQLADALDRVLLLDKGKLVEKRYRHGA